MTDSLLTYQDGPSGLRGNPDNTRRLWHEYRRTSLCVPALCWLLAESVRTTHYGGQLWFAFYSRDKMLTKNNLGRKGFLWLALPHHRALSREARAGVQRRNWRRDHGGGVNFYLAFHGVLSLLSYTTRTTCPTAMTRGQSDGVNFYIRIPPCNKARQFVSSWHELTTGPHDQRELAQAQRTWSCKIFGKHSTHQMKVILFSIAYLTLMMHTLGAGILPHPLASNGCRSYLSAEHPETCCRLYHVELILPKCPLGRDEDCSSIHTHCFQPSTSD